MNKKLFLSLTFSAVAVVSGLSGCSAKTEPSDSLEPEKSMPLDGTYSIYLGNPEMRGSLSGLKVQGKNVLPSDTFKLVYFGTQWDGGCNVGLSNIKNLLAQMRPDIKITPVFVYPDYGRLNILGNRMVENYVMAPGTEFVGLSASPDVVLPAAASFGARYHTYTYRYDEDFKSEVREPKIIQSTDIYTIPRGHTGYAYLMSPDLKQNLFVIYMDGLISNDTSALLQQELRKFSSAPPVKPPSPAP